MKIDGFALLATLPVNVRSTPSRVSLMSRFLFITKVPKGTRFNWE